MELIEVRKVENRSLANYIRCLQNRHKIKMYVSESGYASYDPEEFERYKKTAHRGRPIKIEKYTLC